MGYRKYVNASAGTKGITCGAKYAGKEHVVKADYNFITNSPSVGYKRKKTSRKRRKK